MRVSEALGSLPGVQRAAAVMATPLNIELLSADGIMPETSASPHDLLVVVAGEDEGAAQLALAELDALLAPRAATEDVKSAPLRLIEAAPSNLALIAVPGQYAATEAYAALRAGMHVFLFSDNVPLEDEVRLKQMAAERDLLMMGPDCGTAILDGVGLGFANRVQPGRVGIVGASGTGIQQVCCLLDHALQGVAQAIGTGGRDLSAAVGGSMTRRALAMLEQDDAVEVIALISKPADPGVARELHADLVRVSKPVVACLLGESPADEGAVRYARNLTDQAIELLSMLDSREEWDDPGPEPIPYRLGTRLHGLFSGGTLMNEARQILDAMRVPHALVDLGDDEYTRGRAHPIIDPRLRVSMLVDLAEREDVGAVLIDVILGDLAHPDPAGAVLPALRMLRDNEIPIFVVLIGSLDDPQSLESQRISLEREGIPVFMSNARAAIGAGAAMGGLR